MRSPARLRNELDLTQSQCGDAGFGGAGQGLERPPGPTAALQAAQEADICSMDAYEVSQQLTSDVMEPQAVTQPEGALTQTESPPRATASTDPLDSSPDSVHRILEYNASMDERVRRVWEAEAALVAAAAIPTPAQRDSPGHATPAVVTNPLETSQALFDMGGELADGEFARRRPRLRRSLSSTLPPAATPAAQLPCGGACNPLSDGYQVQQPSQCPAAALGMGSAPQAAVRTVWVVEPLLSSHEESPAGSCENDGIDGWRDGRGDGWVVHDTQAVTVPAEACASGAERTSAPPATPTPAAVESPVVPSSTRTPKSTFLSKAVALLQQSSSLGTPASSSPSAAGTATLAAAREAPGTGDRSVTADPAGACPSLDDGCADTQLPLVESRSQVFQGAGLFRFHGPCPVVTHLCVCMRACVQSFTCGTS